MIPVPRIQLNAGNTISSLGFGVFQIVSVKTEQGL
jgi:hypothetical protein